MADVADAEAAAAAARAAVLRNDEDALQQAEDARQALQANGGEADFLAWLVTTLRQGRRYADALRFARRQLELWREAQALPEVAQTLCNIGELCVALDQVAEATEAGSAAESIFKRLKERAVAKVELLKGQPARALEQTQVSLSVSPKDVAQLAAKQAASLSRAGGDALGEANVSAGEHGEALQVLGEAINQIGDVCWSALCPCQAAVRFRKANEEVLLAEMLIAAVGVHLDVGRLSQARKAADAALAVCRRLKAGEAQLAACLCSSARAHLADGDVRSWSAASEEAKEAREISAQIQDVQGETAAKLLLADALMVGGKLQEAYWHLSNLASERRACGDVEGEATALYHCFRALRDAASTEAAIGTLHQALNLYWSLSDGSGATKCLYALAQLHLSSGDAPAALKALAEVLGMVRRYRRKQRMEALVLQLAAKAMLAVPAAEVQETEKLEAEVKQLAEEKGQAEKELAAATARIQEIQGSLPQKMQQLQHLQQQEQQKEAEYMRMLEAGCIVCSLQRWRVQAKGKGKGPKGPAPKSKGKGGKGKDESQAGNMGKR
ncbi:unnamed protein product [Effrenium voratum]|nr:unnamed protein product [Effrenium voratum]